MNAASLCAGIGGLDLAVNAVWPGTELVWTAEMDRHCRTILARHFPNAHHCGKFCGDGIDDGNGPTWEELPRVDILTAGFPCQDISYAGAGAGIHGRRSSVFFHVARAVRVLRPRWVVLENVGALRSRGLDVVTHTLAGIGYVGSWCSVRASDIGAPHRRERIFIVAHPESEGRQGCREPREAAGQGHVEPRRDRSVPPDPRSKRIKPEHEATQPARTVDAAERGRADVADPDSDGRARLAVTHGEPQPHRAEHEHRDDLDRHGVDRWGPYWPAVHRWERITGERAPDPLVGRRLNPDLPRWMMGYPPGWLDGIPKTAQLRAAGNAVCPQQGALGITRCLDLLGVAA